MNPSNKKQTGSRRYPFRDIGIDGAKTLARTLNKPICVVVKINDGVELARAWPDGEAHSIRQLSMPLRPC